MRKEKARKRKKDRDTAINGKRKKWKEKIPR